MEDIVENIECFLQQTMLRSDIPEDIRNKQRNLLRKLSEAKIDDGSIHGEFPRVFDEFSVEWVPLLEPPDTAGSDGRQRSQTSPEKRITLSSSFSGPSSMHKHLRMRPGRSLSSTDNPADSLLRSSSHEREQPEKRDSLDFWAEQRAISWSQFNVSQEDDYYTEFHDKRTASALQSATSTLRAYSAPSLVFRNQKWNSDDLTPEADDDSNSSTSYESYEESENPATTESSTKAQQDGIESGENAQTAPYNAGAFQKGGRQLSKSAVGQEPPVTIYIEKKTKKKDPKKMLSAVLNALPRNLTLPRRNSATPKQPPSSSLSISTVSIDTSSSSTAPPNTTYSSGLPQFSGFLRVRRRSGRRHRDLWPLRLAILTSQSLCLYKVDLFADTAAGNPGVGSGVRPCLSSVSCGGRRSRGSDSRLLAVHTLLEAGVLILDKVRDRQHVLKLELSDESCVLLSPDTAEELKQWRHHLLEVIEGLSTNPYIYSTSTGGSEIGGAVSTSANDVSNSSVSASVNSVVTSNSEESTGSSSAAYYSYTPWEKNSLSSNNVRLRKSVRHAMRDARERVSEVVGSWASKRRSSTSSTGLHQRRASMQLPNELSRVGVGTQDPIYSSGVLPTFSSSVTMAGYLSVKSRELQPSSAEWKRKFCLLSRGMLSVYRRRQDLQPQLHFSLSDCSLNADPEAVNRRRILIMHLGLERIALEAPDSSSLGCWMSALVRVTSQSTSTIYLDLDEAPTPPSTTPQSPTIHDHYDGYEKSHGDRWQCKLSSIRNHLLSLSGEMSITPSPLYNSCSAIGLLPSPLSSEKLWLQHRRSSLLQRSYDKGVDVESGTIQRKSTNNNTIIRRCFSLEDLRCSLHQLELCRRVVDFLLPFLMVKCIPAPIAASQVLDTRHNATDDYELVMAVPEEDKRDSCVSNYSTGTDITTSEDLVQTEIPLYTRPPSSTSAYSSAGHPASRTNSSVSYDPARNSYSTTNPHLPPQHTQEEETPEPLAEPPDPDPAENNTSSTLGEEEYVPDHYQLPDSHRPPLPIRSKSRRSTASSELEALASRLTRPMRKRKTQQSMKLSPAAHLRHYLSLSNVFFTGSVASSSIVNLAASTSQLPGSVSIGAASPQLTGKRPGRMQSDLTKSFAGLTSTPLNNVCEDPPLPEENHQTYRPPSELEVDQVTKEDKEKIIPPKPIPPPRPAPPLGGWSLKKLSLNTDINQNSNSSTLKRKVSAPPRPSKPPSRQSSGMSQCDSRHRISRSKSLQLNLDTGVDYLDSVILENDASIPTGHLTVDQILTELGRLKPQLVGQQKEISELHQLNSQITINTDEWRALNRKIEAVSRTMVAVEDRIFTLETQLLNISYL